MQLWGDQVWLVQSRTRCVDWASGTWQRHPAQEGLSGTVEGQSRSEKEQQEAMWLLPE